MRFLQRYTDAVRVPDEPLFWVDNRYYREGMTGTRPEMFLREALVIRLREASKSLPPNVSFFLFDGFRSYETQRALFHQVQGRILEKNPRMTPESAFLQTKRYVAHPDDRTKYPVLPHNSGGAIDVALCERGTGALLEFGGAFDEPTEISTTDFYERAHDPAFGIPAKQWQAARENRRVLFNALTKVGFSNYESEWWHYDLGNCLWAKYTGAPWVYDSMEAAVNLIPATQR